MWFWLIVPRALDQVETAMGTLLTSKSRCRQGCPNSHGIKHEILIGFQHRLERLPHGTELIHPGRRLWPDGARSGRRRSSSPSRVAAYWVFEKERAQELVVGLGQAAQAGEDASCDTGI